MRKLRIITAAIIAFLPRSRLRVFFYKLLLGYKIDWNSKIDFGVVIAVDAFQSGPGLIIRRGTSFVGPFRVVLGRKAIIGRRNRFDCGASAAQASNAHKNYARLFKMGDECLIHEDHLFDLYGLVSVGDGTWIAGFGSQFLTHGASVLDRDITIGSNCYLGSAVRFAPGSGVGDRTIVAMGAVVTKNFADNEVIVGGVPAKIIRQRSAEDGYEFKRTW